MKKSVLLTLFIATSFVFFLTSCNKDESVTEPELATKNEWVKISDEDMSLCNTIAISGNDIFVGTILNGAYHSADNGTSWKAINAGLPLMLDFNAFTISGKYLVAATNKGVYRTENKGLGWTSANVGLPDDFKSNDLAELNKNLYVATDNGVFRSSDNGANWISMNNTGLIWLEPLAKPYPIDQLVVQGSHLYATGFSNYFLTSDNGASWIKLNSDLFYCYSFIVSETKVFASGLDGVYRSDDSCDSWNPANEGLKINNTIKAFAVSGLHVYAAGKGMFRTSDNGANWIPYNEGLDYANKNFSELVISGNYIYTTTANGVWKCRFQ